MHSYGKCVSIFKAIWSRNLSHFWNQNQIFCRHVSNKKCDQKLANPYKVHIIPALQDNFMYVLTDEVSQSALAVDPVEPLKIFKFLEEKEMNLTAVLTTHHHLDHCGGNEIIAGNIKNIPIYDGDDRILGMTAKLSHNEVFNVGALSFTCLHTPCHTSSHVCYFTKTDDLNCICFTGDTLFVGGCGRFFEGTAAHMLKSLNILSALPPSTLVFCGHEYTVSNLKFALSVEPFNKCAKEKLKSVEESLSRGGFSVPSTIQEELSYNPFMRTDQKDVQKHTGKTEPVEVMRVLREMKDAF